LNKSRLVLTLKSFTPEELKRLGEFLNSPYFNKSKTLVKFYSELKKFYPGFPEEKISREILYRKLFKDKEYNEQVMKNLISDLNKLCRDFLTVEITRADSFENRLNFLRQMILRKTDPVFFSELKNFENELKKTSEISERNFYYLYQLEEAKISFHLERNQAAVGI
jgi:HKD family nuclease